VLAGIVAVYLHYASWCSSSYGLDVGGSIWHHKSCIELCTQDYELLERSNVQWLCCKCESINVSTFTFRSYELELTNIALESIPSVFNTGNNFYHYISLTTSISGSCHADEILREKLVFTTFFINMKLFTDAAILMTHQ
jgi:PHP family Zn ribbon phosphoesterase